MEAGEGQHKIGVNVEIGTSVVQGAEAKVDQFVQRLNARLDNLRQRIGDVGGPQFPGVAKALGKKPGEFRNEIEQQIGGVSRSIAGMPEPPATLLAKQRQVEDLFRSMIPSGGDAIGSISELPNFGLLSRGIETFKMKPPTDPAQRRAALSMMSDVSGRLRGDVGGFENKAYDKLGKLYSQRASNPSMSGQIDQEMGEITNRLMEGKIAYAQLQDDLKGFSGKVGDGVKRLHRVLPAYIGTVINTLGQAGTMFANVYAAERTMFDMSSPQAQANAMMSLDILKTREYWRGGARTLGSVAGGIAGGMIGSIVAPGIGTSAGAFAGSYLGAQVLGPIGDIMATVKTAGSEAQQKIFNTFFERSFSNVQRYGGVQRGAYDIAGRIGGAPGSIETDAMGLAGKYAMTPEQSMSSMMAFTNATGSRSGLDRALMYATLRKIPMETMMGYYSSAAGMLGSGDVARGGMSLATLPEAMFGRNLSLQHRESAIGLGSALVTPKNEAEQAMLYQALRRAHPGDSFAQTQIRMRKGILGEGNLSAMMGMMPGNMMPSYILAMTEGKGVNAGLTEELMDRTSTAAGRNSLLRDLANPRSRISKSLNESISPAARFESEEGISSVTSGSKMQRFYASLATEHKKWLDQISSTSEMQNQISTILGGVRDSMISVLTGNTKLGWSDVATEGERVAAKSAVQRIVSHRPGTGRGANSPVIVDDQNEPIVVHNTSRKIRITVIEEPTPAHSRRVSTN